MRLLMLVLAFAITISSEAKECSLPTADQDAARDLSAKYVAAWLSRDAEQNVMALMAETSVILPHHGVQPRVGRDNVKGFWFAPNAKPFDLLKLTMDPADVQGCGDIAYVWGTQSVAWRMKDAPEVTSNAGTFLMVARKRAGKWLIERLMWDDPPNQVR